MFAAFQFTLLFQWTLKLLAKCEKKVKVCKNARNNSLNVVNVMTRRMRRDRDIFGINNARCNTEKAAFSIMNLFVPLFRIYSCCSTDELFLFVISFILSVV